MQNSLRRHIWTENSFVCGIKYETKVQRLLRQCGPWATAKYLQKRGYTPQQAVTLMYR